MNIFAHDHKIKEQQKRQEPPIPNYTEGKKKRVQINYK